MRIRWLLVAAVLAGCGGDDEGAATENGDDAGGDATSRDVVQDAPRADAVALGDGAGLVDAVGSGEGAPPDAAGTDAMGANDAMSAGDTIGDASNAADSAGAGDSGPADARSDAPGDARPNGDAANVDVQADARESASDAASSADVSSADASAVDANPDAAADAGALDADDATAADAASDVPPTDGSCTPTSTTVTATPNTAANGFTLPADVSWTNLVFATDVVPTSFANTTVALDNIGTRSRPLIVTDYGFDIPANAVIDGVVVDIWRGSPNSNMANSGIRDEIVRLQSGLINSLSRAKTDKWPANVFTSVPTYGGPLDTWGVAWTPATINASSFGVYLTAQRFSANSDTPRVGWVEITVHYTTTCP